MSTSEAPGDLGESCQPPARGKFEIAREVLLLLLVLLPVYFCRVSDPPLVGEEPRWACGAEEMLRTGDWIVPRQQGQVFPERPPLGSWAMALVALSRGAEVDVLAIRLPSLVAVILTTLVVYSYARAMLSPLAAVASGLAYATFGQVLQIGRLGESEALFALFVGSALLVWHLGYSRGWPTIAMWCTGYGLAALGALVKGPQAPVYFCVVTCVYLLARRDWRRILDWRHAAGMLTFASIVGAWQIPFYLATDWGAVQATWGGLAGDRFVASGFVTHLVTYPVEVAICLLPWSLLLPLYLSPKFRDSLGSARGTANFLWLALAVTFPSVLLASLARGRYFMPLYPCTAVLVGLAVERCASVERLSLAYRGWKAFLAGWGAAALAVATVAVVATFTTYVALDDFDQPVWFALLFAALALIVAAVLAWSIQRQTAGRVLAATLTLAIFSALVRVGLVTNIECARNNPVEQHVAAVRKNLPEPRQLVSFGPVDHRFVYFYRDPIEEIPWPLTAAEIPDRVTYFCLNRYPSDTAEFRADGRGRTSRSVPGTLPVPWEAVAEVPVSRRYNPGPQLVVVIGKIVRSEANLPSESSPAPSDRFLPQAARSRERR